jgi:hypothetical protein
MHRLPLILCAVALLGSTVSGVMYVRIGNSKQVLESRLGDSHARAERLDQSLAAANELQGGLKARLGAAESRISATEVELEATRGRLAGEETRARQLTEDVAATKAVLALYESTALGLAEEVAALRQDLSDARASSASPEAVTGYKSTIAELERQLANARNGAVAPAAAGASTAVFASRAGRASVLNVGPENAFVVLNFGAVRGAQVGQKLSVSQGDEIVATVLVSDVRTNFSIAQVLPETLRGVLHKGDSAVLLR